MTRPFHCAGILPELLASVAKKDCAARSSPAAEGFRALPAGIEVESIFSADHGKGLFMAGTRTSPKTATTSESSRARVVHGEQQRTTAACKLAATEPFVAVWCLGPKGLLRDRGGAVPASGIHRSASQRAPTPK